MKNWKNYTPNLRCAFLSFFLFFNLVNLLIACFFSLSFFLNAQNDANMIHSILSRASLDIRFFHHRNALLRHSLSKILL